MEILKRIDFSKDYSKQEVNIYTLADLRYIAKEGTEGILKLQNNIVTVDFKKDIFFRDPNPALSHVVVLTSDGKLGTLSHLRTDTPVKKFTRQLLNFHGKPTPVCLSGGADEESERLINDIYKELGGLGFITSRSTDNNAIGGRLIIRQAKLFPDRVTVEQKPFYKNDITLQREVSLSFPGVKKNS